MGFYLGVFEMDFFSALSEEKSFLVVSVGVLMAMDICFGNALISPLFIFVRVLNFMISCFGIRVLGLGVFFGMGGYLHLLALVGLPLALLRFTMLLVLGWRDCQVVILKVFVESGFPLIIFLNVLPLLMFLITLMCGLVGVLFLMSYQVLGLAGAVFTLSQVWCWMVWSKVGSFGVIAS